MLNTFHEILHTEEIVLFAPILLRDCRITRPYLLSRAGIEDGTVLIMADPNAVSTGEARNVSCYATARDYHLYFKELFDRVLPILREQFPDNRFVGFSDHSPINEIDAALRAGLGIRGENGLLLTEAFSSYVFLGEIITDAILPTMVHPIRECEKCGACRRACPVELDKSRCLSALTQKKGNLTPEEEALLDAHPLVWGCDICQDACPHTAAARRRGTLNQVPPFFRTALLPYLNEEALLQMNDETFRERAYAWRGREVISRNLRRKNKDHLS